MEFNSTNGSILPPQKKVGQDRHFQAPTPLYLKQSIQIVNKVLTMSISVSSNYINSQSSACYLKTITLSKKQRIMRFLGFQKI